MIFRRTGRSEFFFFIFVFLLSLAIASVDAQVSELESLRYFDVSNSQLNEPCATNSGVNYQAVFQLQQSGAENALMLSSAAPVDSSDNISAMSTNQKVKDCVGIVIDWWGKAYYNIFDLALVDGEVDLQNPYDLQTIADPARLENGFNIASACLSSASEAEYHRCAGLNVPTLEPEHYILYSESDLLPATLDDDYKQIMGWMIEMGLGYDRYIHAIYDLDANNNELLTTLRELGLTTFSPEEDEVHGSLIQTIDQLYEMKTCLGSLQPFTSYNSRFSRKKTYNFCNQLNPYSDPDRQYNRDNDKETFFYGVARNYIHEYFHHTQKAHTLNRDLGTSDDCCGYEDAVEAPPFWIEGAANVFPDLFLWEKFEDMNLTVRNGFERGNGRYHEEGSPAVCQGLDTYLCDQNARLYREKKEQHQQAGGKCYLGSRNGADLYDGSIKQPQCSWDMAAWYLAYTTSFQVMWVDIPRDMWSLGFPGSFEKHVGMTVNEFADEFSSFFNTGSSDDPPPPGFFPDKPLSELVDFWELEKNPSGR